ncbi:MAG: hypothetical protein ACI865_000169 [Flavobacteriaceae bacterium]|jgi:hypothetical protein
MSQSDFYAIDTIRDVRLYFVEDDWDEILDSLYVLGELERLKANVIIDGESYLNVGVRYKGFSSYSSSRDKNPLNIQLDYIDENQNHSGYSKIKLSNVIQDPSFVREALSYEIARNYMPASKANYANVYINDTLIGLYTNVESVEDDFLENHFGSNDHTFVKCNPVSLDLNGENSNLSDSPGPGIDGYFPFYKLKSNDDQDWFELQAFIDTLNTSPQNIEELLNVDRALWMHAFNYTLINFDSYIGYAQNFYLYQDHLGQFNPILWDLNMSFASYRLTDASDNWDGFTIEEAKYIDPLQHLNSFSVQPRPLIRNLLENDTYRRMYMAHIRTMNQEVFESGDYLVRGQAMQDLIDPSVLADTNKFYTYADFTVNLDSTVSDLVDYPGLSELMSPRSNYLLNLSWFAEIPVISAINSFPVAPTSGDSIWISAKITEVTTNASLVYRLSRNDRFAAVQMLDDGTMYDGAAGDSVFGAFIPNCSNNVEYYIYAENDSAGRFSPERAAHEFYTITPKLGAQDLVINEVMSNNQFTQTDQDGDFDNWIELYNNSDYTISTNGLYLTNDQADLTKWAFPEQTILPGAYAIIWADQDVEQYGMHTSLVLDNNGGSLWLSYADGSIVDQMTYGKQEAISSTGRYPNGTGSFIEMSPSYRVANTDGTDNFIADDIFVFPNPANDQFQVRLNGANSATMSMATIDGRIVRTEEDISSDSLATIDASGLESGFYIIRVSYGGTQRAKRILITH